MKDVPIDKIPKLIIVEGPKGVGKSTITNWLREVVPHSELIRMTGVPYTDRDDLINANEIRYNALIGYLRSISKCGLNIILDRMWISENVYSSIFNRYEFNGELGYLYGRLEWLAKDEYDVIILNLQLGDVQVYEDRLRNRHKHAHMGIKFDGQQSMKEENEYKEVIRGIEYASKYIDIYDIDMSENLYGCKLDILGILNAHNLSLDIGTSIHQTNNRGGH